MPRSGNAHPGIATICAGFAALTVGLASDGWGAPSGTAGRKDAGAVARTEAASGESMRGLLVGGGQRGPITINASRFEADNKRRTATYVDRVVARQNGTTLTADRLTVAYDEGRRVSRVTAEGNVRIVQKGSGGGSPGRPGEATPDREAVCGRVVFQVARDLIVCTGGPASLRQGDDIIRGSRITVQVAEERILVEGNGRLPRVTSRITPQGNAAGARGPGDEEQATPGAEEGAAAGSPAWEQPSSSWAGSAQPD